MTPHPIRRIDGSLICEIKADTPRRAVEIAVERKISLAGAYLGGADLRGAYLEGAYLRGAYLGWADLRGAYLEGAYLEGAKITDSNTIASLVARATRIIEPYEFFLWATDKGDLITAGCRAMTLADYRQHTDSYDDADQREETLAILDFLEARWKAYQKKGAANAR